MFLLYLFVCNCTCECMFCVGDHLVQAVLPFVLPIFGKIDNNNNNIIEYTCFQGIGSRARWVKVKAKAAEVRITL